MGKRMTDKAKIYFRFGYGFYHAVANTVPRENKVRRLPCSMDPACSFPITRWNADNSSGKGDFFLDLCSSRVIPRFALLIRIAFRCRGSLEFLCLKYSNSPSLPVQGFRDNSCVKKISPNIGIPRLFANPVNFLGRVPPPLRCHPFAAWLWWTDFEASSPDLCHGTFC